MISICRIGRLFFSIGIIAYGIQQVVILDFRPEIIAGFPGWAHTIKALPIITGLAMVIAGVLISGIIKVETDTRMKLSVSLGFYFFALVFVSHIPYLLFVYPYKLSHLGSWGDLLKELAFSGGAFVMAGSFTENYKQENLFIRVRKIMIHAGRIFFCTTIILYGCTHFVYDNSAMVPQWFGWPKFWSYFGGAALIASGSAILFEVFLKPVSLLLAVMLFLWFLLLHVPSAISYPYLGHGNLIVSAFDALLFSGTALLLSQSKIKNKIETFENLWLIDS